MIATALRVFLAAVFGGVIGGGLYYGAFGGAMYLATPEAGFIKDALLKPEFPLSIAVSALAVAFVAGVGVRSLPHMLILRLPIVGLLFLLSDLLLGVFLRNAPFAHFSPNMPLAPLFAAVAALAGYSLPVVLIGSRLLERERYIWPWPVAPVAEAQTGASSVPAPAAPVTDAPAGESSPPTPLA